MSGWPMPVSAVEESSFADPKTHLGSALVLADNSILAALPVAEQQRLRKLCAPTVLAAGMILQDPGSAIRSVYFPLSGMISIVAALSDGAAVEVGVIGSEGMLGFETVLGGSMAVNLAVVQQDGNALRLDAKVFRMELERTPALRQAAAHAALLYLDQVSQTAACNSRHNVEQRCARWLLMTRDRVGSDSFSLTQEFLAQMLGVRRAGVSAAAGALRSAALISYRRGEIVVLDRRGLAAVSCECYRVLKAHTKSRTRAANASRQT